MAKSKHKWTFPSRFRKGMYSWKGTSKASKNLREAVSEIKKVARNDPQLAAEGATRLLEKIVPAVEGIDSSSGAIGTAANKAVVELGGLVADGAQTPEHESRVERVFEALQEDGYGYLDQLGDEFGDICGSESLAAEWGRRLLSLVRRTFTEGGYFSGTSACLSCLLRAQLHEELEDVLALDKNNFWHWQQYRCRSLASRGKTEEAIRLAESEIDQPGVVRFLEDLLIRSDRWREAFERFGPRMRSTTYLSSFRATAKKYPQLDERTILKAYLARWRGEEGKWFATARSLGLNDLALALARQGPCNPKTIYNGAKALSEKEPEIAFALAMAAVDGYLRGWAYEYARIDLLVACGLVTEMLDGAERREDLQAFLSYCSRYQGSDAQLVRERLHQALEGLDTGGPPHL